MRDIILKKHRQVYGRAGQIHFYFYARLGTQKKRTRKLKVNVHV